MSRIAGRPLYTWITLQGYGIEPVSICETDGSTPESPTDKYGLAWLPLVNFRRVTGDKFVPYKGNTAWHITANFYLKEKANSNFSKGKRHE